MKTPSNIPSNWRDSVAGIFAVGKHLRERKDAIPPRQLREEALKDLLLNKSSVTKLIALSEHKILSDPAYWDKLPAKWALLNEIRYLPDEMLLQKIKDGGLLSATKIEVWTWRGNKTQNELKERAKAYSRSGKERLKNLANSPHKTERKKQRIFVPEGVALSDYCRRGIELEKSGMPLKQVAKTLSLGHDNYRKARTIVNLADGGMLNSSDSKLVADAIQLMDSTRSITAPRAMVASIIEKYWGRGHHRSNKRVKRRAEIFRNAVKILTEACLQGAEIEIPVMEPHEFDEAESQIRTAKKALNTLNAKVRKERP